MSVATGINTEAPSPGAGRGGPGGGPLEGRGPAGRWRRAGIAGSLAVLALVVAAVLTGPPTVDGPPLDPRSTAPDGLAGLLDLASSLGQDVDIVTDLPSDTSVRLLVVRDLLGPEGRDAISEWVADGGRLIVADAASPLHGLTHTAGPVSDLVGPSGRAPECEAPALAEVSRVTHGGWTAYETPEDAVACFGLGEDAAWLVARAHGDGEIVALGSPDPLVNGALDRDDNAVLAAALLFPDESSHLEVLPPDPAAQAQAVGEDATEPDVGPGDLLPAQLPGALVVVVLAVGALLLAVGRRLGRPVEERLPPTLPSAELARSVGELLQRAGSRAGAATRLRHAARTEAAGVLGVEALDQSTLADQAAHRLALAPDLARRALVDLPVEDDDDLVAVASATATLHERLARAGL